MRKKTFFFISIFFLILSILQAKEGKKRPLEVFAFFNLNFGAINTAYQNTYSLNFPSSLPGSYASQTLNIQGKAGEGFNTGFSFFIPENLGLKISMNYSRNLRSLSFFLNLQYRFVTSKDTIASFSAGSGIISVYGNFNHLAYSEYWIGGHGVLFSKDYLLKLKMPSSGKIGFNADIELGFRLTGSLSLAAKVAYILCRSISVKPTIEEALFYYSLDRVEEDKLPEQCYQHPGA
jgi:hypothetical protein